MILVFFPEPHSLEKLAALFWDDSRDELAPRSLRAALAAIRKELGDDVLVADREIAQINPAYSLWVDVREIANRQLQIADSEIVAKLTHYRRLFCSRKNSTISKPNFDFEALKYIQDIE